MKEILFSSSVLILAIILARHMVRGRVSQRLLYATWLLVALRLLIPIQFGQSAYSISTLTDQLEQSAEPIRQVQQSFNEPIAGPSRAELYEQLLNTYIRQGADPTAPAVQEQIESQIEKQIITPIQVLTVIWITGMTLMAVWFFVTNFIYLRNAKKDAVPFTQVDAPVPVMVSPNVPTPCLMGLFRPVIYLTPASTASEQTLNHVLTHELAHFRHGDHIWSLVRCVCLCVYWFDPLVWLAAVLSRRDQELACDESALKKLGSNEHIPYGETLLATVSQAMSPSHILETATAMNETKKAVERKGEFYCETTEKNVDRGNRPDSHCSHCRRLRLYRQYQTSHPN